MSKKSNQQNNSKTSYKAAGVKNDVQVGSCGGAFKKGANARPGAPYEAHGGNPRNVDPDRSFN